MEGDLDLHGFLGVSESVRNGFEGVKVTVRIKARASDKKLEELYRIAQKHSPVFDMISKPVPVSIQVESVNPSPEPDLRERYAAGVWLRPR